MKRYDFTIPIYDVDVTLLQVEKCNDSECRKVCSVLRSFGCPKESVDEEISQIREGSTNGGVTYRNMVGRKMLVLFQELTSVERLVEVYSHEKRHIEDRILEFFKVSDSESAALLSGYVSVEFYKFFGESVKKFV